MSWLSTFLTPFVQHAGMAAAGTLLIASPIIIHLINRMRYRRVRFAAMEFLFASQQKNRRRLLIEQLILLLLRILLVLGIVALIARLVLNPSQLSLFQGAKTHHVVLLDDSGSMQDRWGETSAWKESLDVISKLVGDGASRPNTQRFSLLLMSRPGEPLFVQEDVNNEFATRLKTRMENLANQGTFGPVDLLAGLEEARKLLAEDKAVRKTLHVVSDFRQQDWVGQKAISGAIEALDKGGVGVNLVRTVPERHTNLAISDLSGDLHVAAAGVPLRLKVGVQNFGQAVAKDVRVSVFQDDQKLPLTIHFLEIEAGKTAEEEFDVVFEQATRHTIRVSLEVDSLAADNSRWLAVDVPPKNSVLVIDGDPSSEEGFYVADALAANPTLTGFAPLVENMDYLRRHPLHQFQCIYLINIPELPADAVEPLRVYVEEGGGLAWFVGDLVRPAFYNETLYAEGKGLFPVPLGPARRELPANDGTTPGPDLDVAQHPIFDRDLAMTNPFIHLVTVEQYFPVADGWERDDNARTDGVQTIATLRNKQPVMFEHQRGKGRIVTCLTSAGVKWNNWAKGPSYPISMLELEKYIARQDRSLERKAVGQALDFSLDPTEYLEPGSDPSSPNNIEIYSPAAPDIPIGIKANRPIESKPAGDAKTDAEKAAGAAGESVATTGKPDAEGATTKRGTKLVASFRETRDPGVYRVSLVKSDGSTKETRLYALNVPAEEGDLELATNDDIRKRVGGNVRLEIQEAGNFQWIQGRETKHEIRKLILGILALLLIAEQLMAFRLSYHPKLAGAAA